MATRPAAEGVTSVPLVVLVADLSGYHRALRTHGDEEAAVFLDRFYRLCDRIITEAGGRVIKFMGDAVLASFPEGAAQAAVGATMRLESEVRGLAAELTFDLVLGANLHAGPVVAGEIGGGASRRHDILGRTVNQAFLLGRGRGVRISERVYRALASGERGPWQKVRPPVHYEFREV